MEEQTCSLHVPISVPIFCHAHKPEIRHNLSFILLLCLFLDEVSSLQNISVHRVLASCKNIKVLIRQFGKQRPYQKPYDVVTVTPSTGTFVRDARLVGKWLAKAKSDSNLTHLAAVLKLGSALQVIMKRHV